MADLYAIISPQDDRGGRSTTRLKLFEPTEAIASAEGRRKESFNALFADGSRAAESNASDSAFTPQTQAFAGTPEIQYFGDIFIFQPRIFITRYPFFPHPPPTPLFAHTPHKIFRHTIFGAQTSYTKSPKLFAKARIKYPTYLKNLHFTPNFILDKIPKIPSRYRRRVRNFI